MQSARRCPYTHKDDPWSSHSLIATALADLQPGARVLDVGAATGTLGKILGGSGLSVDGIEPAPGWAAAARRYYAAFYCGGLDDAPEEFLAGHDAVAMADVLEHMVDPERSLRRLAALQPEGCAFAISVPNVANLWVRLNLALGRFEYGERGILDRTHLRFFTRRSLLRMLAKAGLRMARVEVTPVPVYLAFPRLGGLLHNGAFGGGLASLTRLRPTLLGYQFVVRAYKFSRGGVEE